MKKEIKNKSSPVPKRYLIILTQSQMIKFFDLMSFLKEGLLSKELGYEFFDFLVGLQVVKDI